MSCESFSAVSRASTFRISDEIACVNLFEKFCDMNLQKLDWMENKSPSRSLFAFQATKHAAHLAKWLNSRHAT